MPAFMFEKIAPPVHQTVSAGTMREPRGVIVQMIDRLAENRLTRDAKLRKSRPVMSFTEADIKPT